MESKTIIAYKDWNDGSWVNLVNKCKNLSYYEYYDGVTLKCDDGQEILLESDEDEEDNGIMLTNMFDDFGKLLPTLTNLETLIFDSRFPSECDFSEIEFPKSLKNLYICNLTGLQVEEGLMVYTRCHGCCEWKKLEVFEEEYDCCEECLKN